MNDTARRMALIGLLGLLGMTGCAPAPQSETPAGSAGSAFHALTLDQALAKARDDDKLVMVDFYTEWCGPCKMLDAQTWKDAKVQDWLRTKTIAIKLDAEKESKWSDQYKIAGYPTMVFLKPDGSEVGRLVGFLDGRNFLIKAGNIVGGKDAGGS
jgi:thiol:disulfide interchange protein